MVSAIPVRRSTNKLTSQLEAVYFGGSTCEHPVSDDFSTAVKICLFRIFTIFFSSFTGSYLTAEP